MVGEVVIKAAAYVRAQGECDGHFPCVLLPSYFGAPANDAEYPMRAKKVEDWGQLKGVLQGPGIQEGKGLNIIEIIMEMDDAPENLKKFVEYLKRRNSGLACPIYPQAQKHL